MSDVTEQFGVKDTVLPALSLLSSVGTLMCCALPALFVAIGAGAALAGLVSAVPWLVALSQYKLWTFGGSGLLIVLSGLMLRKSNSLACPPGSREALWCQRLREFTSWVYWASILIWSIGFFFAFMAVYFMV
jgi:hypothetical protein